MPFKSDSQRRKFLMLVKEGKMSQATFDEWESATGKKKLPERIGPKRNPKGPLKSSLKELSSYTKKRFGL